MANDLSRGICPAAEVKCLVIDEAHRALGNHAYCQVVKELWKHTQHFRILALTATPGSDAKAVQQVISNLLISHIELYTEDSPEIQPYSYQRQIEKCVVPLGKDLAEIQNAYIQVLEAFTSRLTRLRILSHRDIPTLTKYQIILARDQFRKNPAPHLAGMPHGAIEGDFALCISLYHGYELLLQVGIRSLHAFLRGIMDGEKGMTRARNELVRNEDFMKLYNRLQNLLSSSEETSANCSNGRAGAEPGKPFFYSHPKLKKLEEVVVGHFRSWKEREGGSSGDGRPAETRVMVFSSFRDSVQEIAEMLSQHHPLVKVMTFLGQSAGKRARGFTQKEQLEVVKHFRDGGYNTLVSTCVGEEGLDIGEVDLIVCFDAQKSPVRLVQRMGRTGRKRKGRIVVVLSEGREERMYNQSQSNRRSLLKVLSENKGLQLCSHSPRMIPEGINPTMHRMLVIPTEEESEGPVSPPKPFPLSTGTGTNGARRAEAWCLTDKEFERWNRLYKMEAGDGMKKPVMPQSHFETLEHEEQAKPQESQGDEVHELSLTEWRLWQNRPFPTDLVDHSDRCRHFVAVMEMIEQMRQEEGACGYDQSLQPHLRWEDVGVPDVQRGKCRHDAAAARKPSLPKNAPAETPGARGPPRPSEELGVGRLSLFGAAALQPVEQPRKPSAGTAAAAPGAPGPSGSFPASSSSFVEDARWKGLPGEKRENLAESTGANVLRGSAASYGSLARGEVPPPSEECSSCRGRGPDSTAGGLAEDDVPLSPSLFYLPAPEADPFALPGVRGAEDPSWAERLGRELAVLLSQSPPSPSRLPDFEEWGESQAQPPGSASGVFPGSPLEERAPSTEPATTPQSSLGPVEPRRPRCANERPLDLGSVSEASICKMNDVDWDEFFDTDNEGANLLLASHGPAVDALGRNAGGGQQNLCKTSGGNAAPDQASVRLLEGGHSAESDLSPGRKGRGVPVSVEAGGPATAPSSTAGRCSDGLAQASHAGPSNPQEIHWGEALEVAGDCASEADLQGGDEPYDASLDLFSVNFDLGFSVQGSEGEATEAAEAEQSHVALCPASPEALPGKISNIMGVSPAAWSDECLERAMSSTPSRSQNRDSGLATMANGIPWASPFTPTGDDPCQPPALALPVFSTPISRQPGQPRFPRGASVGCFPRNSLEGPQVPVAGKANAGIVRVLADSAFKTGGLVSRRAGAAESGAPNGSSVFSAEVGASSESEEEIVFPGKHKRKGNILASPKASSSDLESPIRAVKKRRRLLSEADSSSEERTAFVAKSSRRKRDGKSRAAVKGWKRRRGGVVAEAAIKAFLDQEAELSDEAAAEVSSDESVCSDGELSSSLARFLDDESQITQGLNESDMQAVYLKSVRSPAVGSRYQLVHKGCASPAVFAQVPEQEESYLQDSFCVGDNEEGDPECGSSEEEVCVNFSLLQGESFADGKAQYCTRRRRRLKEARGGQGVGVPPPPPRKPSRIRILDSSSEEGGARGEEPADAAPPTEAGAGAHPAPSLAPDRPPHRSSSAPEPQAPLPQERRAQAPLEQEAALRGERHPRSVCRDQGPPEQERPPRPIPAPSAPPGPPRSLAPLRVLVDSREICSGPGVVSALKAAHGAEVQACPLGSCDYVASSRLAVERKRQAELCSAAGRSRVVQRVQQLRRQFDRICVIVEEEQVRAGEARKPLRRTKHYDGVLSALVRAGVRVLFSSCQEETAGWLAELALLERRKDAAILGPTELQGLRQDALRFYLSIPCVSYALALALCHRFGSVKEVLNSSPAEVAARAQVSRQKADELFHYVRYGFDAQLLPEAHR